MHSMHLLAWHLTRLPVHSATWVAPVTHLVKINLPLPIVPDFYNSIGLSNVIQAHSDSDALPGARLKVKGSSTH